MQGNYAQALPLFQRALNIRDKALGPDHPDVANSLNNLAELYQAQGNHDAALPLLQRASKIFEKTLGPEHPDFATALSNLAEEYSAKGNYAQALPLFQRALNIRDKALGPDHPDVADSLNDLGGLYTKRGNYAEALKVYQRALKIDETALGPDHPDVANSLNNLASLYKDQGDAALAEPLFQRALKIRVKACGADHPDVALGFDNLVTLEAASGQWHQAASSQDQSRRVIRRHVARVLPSLSPNEQAMFLQANQGSFYGSLSLGFQRHTDPSIVNLSTGWLLNGKGVAQEALSQNVQLARDSTDPKTAASAKQLLQKRQQFAALFYAAPEPGQEQAHRSQLDQLQQQEEELSRIIAQAHGEAFQADPWIDVAAVRKAVRQGAMLVDIARFEPFNFQAKGNETNYLPARYAAWVVPAAGQGDIQIIDLGEADPIDRLVVLARREINRKGQLRSNSTQQEQAAQQAQNKSMRQSAERGLNLEDDGQSDGGALQRLAQLIFEPLQPHLDNATQLIISPDASLWLVPWGALPVAGGQYAIEKYQISYNISGRDLVVPPAGNQRLEAPVMFANPDYDLQPSDVARATNAALVRLTAANQPLAMTREVSRSAGGAFHASRLPGTAEEAKAIGPQLKAYSYVEPVIFLDRDAVEGAFKALKRPQVLVLSTHGFFLADQEVKHDEAQTRGLIANGDKRAVALTTEGKSLENPLLRCGLLLAGCNQSQPVDTASGPGVAEATASNSNGVDDGILTGMEIVGTDLRGTELVVLSACETGVGQVRNGEGVAGLRQAFQLAGAQSVVATLWQIPDRESSQIMSDFFVKLSAGQSKADALRNAQLAAIRASRSATGDAPPFYWAAFTITGE